MSEYILNGILEHLREELILTEVKAREIGSRFEALRIETESMKIDALQDYIVEQRKSTARNSGIISIIKDRNKVRYSLIVAVSSLVFGGLVTRNKYRALDVGMSGFDGMVQGFGETR